MEDLAMQTYQIYFLLLAYIYLPRKSYLTELLVKEFHQNYFMLDHLIHSHKFETITGSHKWNLQKESWWSIQDVENVTLASKKVE